MNDTAKDFDPVEEAVKAATEQQPKKRKYVLKKQKRKGWKWSWYAKVQFKKRLREKKLKAMGEQPKKVYVLKKSLPKYIKVGDQIYVNGNTLVKELRSFVDQLLGTQE